MKYLITERQFKLIKEENNEIRIIPYFMANENWYDLQEFINGISDPPPPYILRGDVNLRGVDVVTLGSLVGVEGDLNLGYNKIIEDLGNLQSVKGNLYLSDSNIESLGNLQSVGGYLNLYDSDIISLGNLQSVGGDLNLYNSNIESLGNLVSVGGDLDLRSTKVKSLGNLQYVGGDLVSINTPLSKTTTEEEIRSQVEVVGKIYL